MFLLSGIIKNKLKHKILTSVRAKEIITAKCMHNLFWNNWNDMVLSAHWIHRLFSHLLLCFPEGQISQPSRTTKSLLGDLVNFTLNF